MLIDSHALKDGSTHSKEIAVPSPLSPTRMASTQHGGSLPGSLATQDTCHRSPPVSSAPQLLRARLRHRLASDVCCPTAQGRPRLR